MRRPALPARAQLRALAPLVVAGFLALAANAAVGLEPTHPSAIPDSAFVPVSIGPQPLADSARPEAVPERTPDLRPIRDPWLAPAPAPAERTRPAVPAPDPIVRVIPKPTPAPAPAREQPRNGGGGKNGGGTVSTGNSISGLASWYCRAGRSPCTYGYPDGPGFDAYAAAGPKLRAAIGPSWRGRIITVDGISVKLIDWCQCYRGEPHEKLLDLYYDVFARTGSNVRIRW